MKHENTFRQHLVSAVAASAITLLASYIVYLADVPNPVIILAAIMILFTAVADYAAGAASGICIILYALFFFSEDHSLIYFTSEGMYKCIVILISLLLIYLIVAKIRHKNDDAYRKLDELNERLERQNEMLQKESDLDGLTGVCNRRGGIHKIEEILSRKSSDFKALLVAMDIDNFKEINDTYGHPAGDKALIQFSECLKKEFSEDGVLIRNGGDEFQMFLYGKDMKTLEDKVNSFIAGDFSIDYQKQTITFQISCGYAWYPEHGDNVTELYRKADLALYYAKISGKHTALCYSEERDGKVTHQLSTRSVARNLPVSFMVYRADESERILMASDSLLQLCECKNFEEFMNYSGGSFHSFVYSEDVEQVEQEIARQIQVNKHGVDSINYRIRTRTEKMLQIHDIGRLVKDPELGNLFYVVLYDRDTLLSAAEEF